MKKGMVGFLAITTGLAAGAVGISYIKNKTIAAKSAKVDKFKGYYNLLNQWLVLKSEGKSLDMYFHDYQYKSIAIYGMGELGCRLYDELKNSDIEVKYAIDKNAENTYSELTVLSLEDELDDVDVVIVTAFFDFNSIEEKLSSKLICPIISLEDVVYSL